MPRQDRYKCEYVDDKGRAHDMSLLVASGDKVWLYDHQGKPLKEKKMTDFTTVDMLAEISKALEYENDWTQLKDGVLECRLRDQYDGEHTGLARVTVDKAGKVSVMAWSDNPYEYATMSDPDWTHDYDSTDPEAIAEDIWNRCPYCGREADKCMCERCAGCGAFLDWDNMADGDYGYCEYCH